MTAPCPYLKDPHHACDHEKKCPVYLYEKTHDCLNLIPAQIAMVQAWVAGHALTREEANTNEPA